METKEFAIEPKHYRQSFAKESISSNILNSKMKSTNK